jgi:CRP/FNR family transcriptional regulator, cyclic AMP receptor protein
VDTLMALLTDDERAALVSATRVRRFARNEVVFHEGDSGDTLHIVERGLFVARSASTLGHVLTVNVFRPGSVFGELALLSSESGQRTATIVALRAGSTRVLRRDVFEGLRGKNPAVDRFLLAVLAERNRALTAQLIELMFTPAPKRVLRGLMRLDELGLASDKDGWVHLGQEELAMLTGTTRATVNRVLRQAETDGLIQLARGRSRIIQRPAMVKRAR